MAERPIGDDLVPGRSNQEGRSTGDRDGGSGTTCLLFVGEGELADATARALAAGGAEVRPLDEPTDRHIRDALDDRIDRVVVISRFDHVSLRRALVVGHVRPGISVLVTIFDRDVAAHLQERSTRYACSR